MYFRNLGVSVRNTSVGRGVFAVGRSFRKGQVVGEMKGEHIDDGNYDPCYVVDLGETTVLSPTAPFCYLNHCCTPNAELVEEETEGGPSKIWVEALRAIRKGEQITIDYQWPAEPEALRCGCGAKSCRGWVVAASEVAQMDQLSQRATRR